VHAELFKFFYGAFAPFFFAYFSAGRIHDFRRVIFMIIGGVYSGYHASHIHDFRQPLFIMLELLSPATKGGDLAALSIGHPDST
jgi:hypothetical protein